MNLFVNTTTAQMHCALGSDTALERLKNMWIIHWGVGLIKVRFIFTWDKPTLVCGSTDTYQWSKRI